jgi:hypothetical protein
MRLQRLDYIEQEHRIFSAYVQASFSDNIDRSRIFSSLVVGDNFIHSYNFASVGGSLLSIRTYSRYGSSCFRGAWGGDPDAHKAMSDYLKVSRASWSIILALKYELGGWILFLFRPLPKVRISLAHPLAIILCFTLLNTCLSHLVDVYCPLWCWMGNFDRVPDHVPAFKNWTEILFYLPIISRIRT